MKEQLERYAELKSIIKEATEEMDLMKPGLLSRLEEGNKYDIGNAVIEISPGKPKWKYSEAVTLLDEDLKKSKKEEEQLGVAEQVHGAPFITCNFKKTR